MNSGVRENEHCPPAVFYHDRWTVSLEAEGRWVKVCQYVEAPGQQIAERNTFSCTLRLQKWIVPQRRDERCLKSTIFCSLQQWEKGPLCLSEFCLLFSAVKTATSFFTQGETVRFRLCRWSTIEFLWVCCLSNTPEWRATKHCDSQHNQDSKPPDGICVSGTKTTILVTMLLWASRWTCSYCRHS